MNQSINQSVFLVVIGGVVIGALVYGIMILALGVKEGRLLLKSAGQFVRQINQ
jgi:hypothetical protein